MSFTKLGTTNIPKMNYKLFRDAARGSNSGISNNTKLLVGGLVLSGLAAMDMKSRLNNLIKAKKKKDPTYKSKGFLRERLDDLKNNKSQHMAGAALTGLIIGPSLIRRRK